MSNSEPKKKLIIIRHAKSSWSNAEVNDFDRPLNNRGIADAPKMAKRLQELIPEIDLFLSSPALRTTSTIHFLKTNSKLLQFSL